MQKRLDLPSCFLCRTTQSINSSCIARQKLAKAIRRRQVCQSYGKLEIVFCRNEGLDIAVGHNAYTMFPHLLREVTIPSLAKYGVETLGALILQRFTPDLDAMAREGIAQRNLRKSDKARTQKREDGRTDFDRAEQTILPTNPCESQVAKNSRITSSPFFFMPVSIENLSHFRAKKLVNYIPEILIYPRAYPYRCLRFLSRIFRRERKTEQ